MDLQQRVQMALNEAQEADGGCPDRGVTPVWKLSIIDASDLQSNSGESSYPPHYLVRCERTQFNLLCNYIF